MPIIDVHTHMFTRHWLELLSEHGNPYGVRDAIRGGNALRLFEL